ncbi:hypothetical protein CRG98_038106 [Punica granatum]|uniref:Uncharacterized protein n=1 Tax=Punica granatum TaxID=22663 RepID=A0A2I0IC01_PUNGR|nr:hypothetical protein CRG98_038106 [Punica granatum]
MYGIPWKFGSERKEGAFMHSGSLSHINVSYKRISRILTLLSCRGTLPSLDARGKESGKQPWESQDSGWKLRVGDPGGSAAAAVSGKWVRTLAPATARCETSGCARWIGSRIVTTSSRGRVRVVRNPLNVMARLAEVVEQNGELLELGAAGHEGSSRGLGGQAVAWDLAEILDRRLVVPDRRPLAREGLGTCDRDFLSVPRMSWGVRGITVISVFRECAPKIHREAFATTETSLREPCSDPNGRLKLVS